MNKYIGGCACESVNYESTGNPKFSFHCQCKHCQKATGSGHASLIIFAESDVTINGDLNFYEQEAESGNILSRGFCPICGSHVVAKSTGMQNMVFITAGSLNDPGIFKPQGVLWTSSGQHWDIIDTNLKLFETVYKSN